MPVAKMCIMMPMTPLAADTIGPLDDQTTSEHQSRPGPEQKAPIKWGYRRIVFQKGAAGMMEVNQHHQHDGHRRQHGHEEVSDVKLFADIG